MIIELSFPPNYDIIKAVFKDLEEVKPIFCYGGIIHNPFGVNVTPDMEYHEEVHSKQQGDDIEGWYRKYLSDPKFRYEQELEAYGKQYHWVKSKIPAKFADWGKENMAMALANNYGLDISYGEAESKIRNYGKET